LFARFETHDFARRDHSFGAGFAVRGPMPRLARAHALDKARFMLSNTVSTTISAFVLVIPALFASPLTISPKTRYPGLNYTMKKETTTNT
jgi:hypothetical protein